MIPRPLLALLCMPMLLAAQALSPTAPSTAPAPPPAPILTGDQTASIMKQLEQLETQVTKSRGEILGTALAKFRSAMTSSKEALGLYLECYKLEHYDRRDLKQTDFQAWKESNDAKLKDEEFLNELMLQLEYLVLTIQAQDVKEQKDMGPLVSALQAFIGKALTAVQATVKHTASGAVESNNKGGNAGRPGGGATGARGPGRAGPGTGLSAALRQSVKNSEFSNAYLLENHLNRREWAYAPLDIAGIYDNVIFPYFLEVKPAELSAQWDSRINAELGLRKIVLSETEYGVEHKERQPDLLWQKALYLYQHKINALQAMADMLKLIRENPMHPQAGAWLKELRSIVSETQPPPPFSPSAKSPAAAAGTAPPN